VEWPAQAAGRTVDGGTVYLARLSAMAGGFVPRSAGEANIQAQLLQALMRLSDAREERLSAALSAVPGIVWLVLILGGALTVAFGSFLGAPSLGMHLAMSSLLAVSGALVLLLIIALSHPFRGDFRVSTQPFEQALRQMADVPSPQ
jgi:hypothetical protein